MKKVIVVLVIAFSSAANAVSPVNICLQSLRKFNSVPSSMVSLCYETNDYSARAIKKYATRFTSLPFSMMQLLLVVDSERDLRCVSRVADTYDTLDHYVVAESCFNTIYY